VFKKDGKVVEEKAGRQFKDAMTPARAAKIRGERIEGKRLSRKEVREAQAVTKWTVERLWQEYSVARGVSDTDRSRYVKHLQPVLGMKEPQHLVPLDVDRVRHKLGKALSPQTVKHVLVLLNRIVNFGVKKGLCPGLSFKIEMPRVDNLKTEDLNPEQLTALLDAIDQDHDPQVSNLMLLALLTGMRRGELFKLQWQDIDFDWGFIWIRWVFELSCS